MQKNRDCESFTQLLLENTRIVLDDSWQTHLRTCKSCQQLFTAHEKSMEALKDRVTLPALNQQEIFSRLQQAIQGSEQPETNIWKSRINTFISYLNTRFAIAALVLLFGCALFIFMRPTGLTTLRGPATILVESKKIRVDQSQMPLGAGKKVWLLDGTLHLFWTNQETIAVNGQIEFSALPHGLKITSGNAVLSFLPSSRGYSVVTKYTRLTIVGTVIRVELSDTAETVVVDKGRIHWELCDGSRSGELTAGAGIVVKFDSNGKMIVGERIDIGRDGRLESLSVASDGVKLKKTGKNWIKSTESDEPEKTRE